MKKITVLLIALSALVTGCVAYPERDYRDGRSYGQRDRDRDGVPNRADRDRDGDGVRNSRDNYPNNPSYR